MNILVSDYIASYLNEKGIKNIFTVVGGGAMYLNDSFGHHKGLSVLYHHHEQAAAIAAESYARVTNKLAAVCVTSGPGGTNALTGALCGYMGSIPMLIFSGQVRYSLTVRGSGLPLRTVGEQEFDICRAAASMTKYCEMIIEPHRVKYHLEKAIFLATSGRPGPTWLDIPMDIQNARIDPDTLVGFDPQECAQDIPSPVAPALAADILDRVYKAKRPVLYVGMGIRLAGAYDAFLQMLERLDIPVVTGMSSVDFVPNEHPLYAGRAGMTGDRAGNFAVQNSDLLLSIGNRLSMKHTGYNIETWARGAYKIVCDIDRHELQRSYLKIDLPIWADAGDLIARLTESLNARSPSDHRHADWIQQCRSWVATYPVVTPDQYRTSDGKANIYVFYHELSKLLQNNDILVTTSGMSRVVGRQAMIIKKGQRFIVNHATSPMGYCLPAAIGVCVANNNRPVTLVTGEGGFQMNIQELQTIKHNKLPIRIIVINNEGYHSIRQTQHAFFKGHSLVGVGDESGDLSFPDLEKIALAYGFSYLSCRNNEDLGPVLKQLVSAESHVICEVYVTTAQATQPKTANKRLDDGRMVSAPLEDMAPFLSREELRANMFIPLIDES
ncbi:MAG: thiamine pyrophosphate-binding protein [Deltaproteobacteria bacterium]|nr:thiamine pyrophosphate-binding protein [Deltaproteobacteria bacterium]